MSLYIRSFRSFQVALFALFALLAFHYSSTDLSISDSGVFLATRSVPVSPTHALLDHVPYNLSLVRRDDYSCGPGRPCSNGACCGESGFCGYGSTYCGSGCVSNCNAKAECGKDAVPAGTTCPLNTCCSQYGFCGTSEDFCGKNCQSNCVLHPSPPGSGGGSDVLKKVIGYYESWSARKTCHQVAPADLPLDGLTHLNFAFAYIDPKTFEIVTMDTQTPAALFQEVVDVKKYKSDLKVWISVGGWTFSDNSTATQPVFGNIAASAANRQSWANNVVKFCNYYGFDGIDIDWEYPGAPDRGGRKEDTENFVSLLQTLRATFDASPRALGITFTAPSSYWYLRWFDLPGLLKYADWVNLMTYDLHGVWDRNNPIGSIVQGHTNLTEIASAAELLWRVGVPPEKVIFGFGFYGRTFELLDKACTTPGCQFKGGAAAGPCSETSGILMYYEIMNLLRQHPELRPIHDEKAAVKYVVFNSNQWVSWDDTETFKQKVDWANKQGFGGSLIWASDLDDDNYTAHSGLLGKPLSHQDLSLEKKKFSANPGSIAQNLVGQNGQKCQVLSDCKLGGNGCPSGQSKVGWEQGRCKRGYGHPICCPLAATPAKCIWRGSGGDCNGQCHPGEATLFRSSWGGSPTESNQNQCSRGVKVFCCESADWKQVIEGCYWTGCGGSCKSGTESVSERFDSSVCTIFRPHYQYCCPTPSVLYDCQWRGTFPDCADAKCKDDEVAIDNNRQGSGILGFGCLWGRKRTDCCKVGVAPVKRLTCKKNLCDITPALCSNVYESSSAKRSLSISESAGHLKLFDKRMKDPKGDREFRFIFLGITILWHARRYPSRSRLFGTAAGLRQVIHRYWRLSNDQCGDTTVVDEPVDVRNNPSHLPKEGESEHPLDLSTHKKIAEFMNNGVLPSGRKTTLRLIPGAYFKTVYFADDALPAGLPPVASRSPELRTPANRVYEAYGSNSNRENFVLAERQINGIKGAIFGITPPISADNFLELVHIGAGAHNEGNIEPLLQPLRAAIAVFNYVNSPEVLQRLRNVRDLIHAQFVIIENNTNGGGGMAALFDEFFPDYMQSIATTIQEWMRDRVRDVREGFARVGPRPRYEASVLIALLELEQQIDGMFVIGYRPT